VNIPDDLYRKYKKLEAEYGTSLTKVITLALREFLNKKIK